MSATDELRKLLDERGVEHYDGTEYTLWLKEGEVYRASANEGLKGLVHLHFWCTTPEQAVEATLGRGECLMEHMPECSYNDLQCSACGTALWGFLMDRAGDGVKTKPYYCPWCGREVER